MPTVEAKPRRMARGIFGFSQSRGIIETMSFGSSSRSPADAFALSIPARMPLQWRVRPCGPTYLVELSTAARFHANFGEGSRHVISGSSEWLRRAPT